MFESAAKHAPRVTGRAYDTSMQSAKSLQCVPVSAAALAVQNIAVQLVRLLRAVRPHTRSNPEAVRVLKPSTRPKHRL